MIKTPVVLLMFKRPQATEIVFEAIRQAKPPKLLVIADGPRQDKPGEAEKCAAARKIIDRVDWNCEVLKNYSEINLGCAKRVAGGLDWVFENVEEAIILEDDCLPHSTFFRFCEDLLEKYRYDERVGSISGQNVQFGKNKTEYSYYFSRYNHVWGWATWRRAWKYFDFELKNWLEVKERNLLQNILGNPRLVYKWTKNFNSIHEGLTNSWAYRWQFACWIHNLLGVISDVNLICNIGFGIESTHTFNQRSKYCNLSTEAIEFPLKCPPFMIRHVQADEFTEKTLFYQATLWQKTKAEIKYLLEVNKI